VGVKQLFLEGLQLFIVQVKFELEGAIPYPPFALEQLAGLFDDFREFHPHSSLVLTPYKVSWDACVLLPGLSRYRGALSNSPKLCSTKDAPIATAHMGQSCLSLLGDRIGQLQG